MFSYDLSLSIAIVDVCCIERFHMTVKAAILVFQYKEAVDILMYQRSPLKINVNSIFMQTSSSIRKPTWPLVTCALQLDVCSSYFSQGNFHSRKANTKPHTLYVYFIFSMLRNLTGGSIIIKDMQETGDGR